MKAQVISFHCVLRNKLGKLISSSFNQELITLDGTEPSNVLPGLVQGLKGLKPGEKKEIQVPAEEAFGLYDRKLVVQVPKKQLPTWSQQVQVGDQVPGETEDGSSLVFRVIEIEGKFVTLDANHPLAGEDLVFEVEATALRDATDADMLREMTAPAGEYLH